MVRRADGSGDATAREFFQLGEALLVSTRTIVEFRTAPETHDIWKQKLEPRLRPPFRQPRQDLEHAERDAEDAGYDHHLALRGAARLETPTHRRSPAAAKTRLDRAEARMQRAQAAINSVTLPRARMRNALISRELREMAGTLHDLRGRYDAAYDGWALQLATTDRAGWRLHEWAGASAAEVLGLIAQDVGELLAHDADDSKYMESAFGIRRLRQLDCDAWKSLETALRCEAGLLARPMERSPDLDHVDPRELIQQKVAATILGKGSPELSKWLRKIQKTGWVHPAWTGAKERFHYLLQQFAGGTFVRSRVAEVRLWMDDLDKKGRPTHGKRAR